MPRTEQIGLRLTKSELERLKQAAADEEVTAQAYVRALVMRATGSSSQASRVVRDIADELLRDYSHADRVRAIRENLLPWRIIIELGRSAGWTVGRIRDEFFSVKVVAGMKKNGKERQ